MLYHKGTGVEINYVAAARFMEKAAHAGHSGAQAHMGALYYNGLGVLQDDRTALCWYARSAVQGNLMGALGLATIYLRGRGAEKSLTKAYAWMNLGSRNGNPKAREIREILRTILSTKEVLEAQALSRRLLSNEERITELTTTACNLMEDP